MENKKTKKQREKKKTTNWGLNKNIILCCMALTTIHISYAQTAIWTGNSDDSWSNQENWVWDDGSTGIPTLSTDVIIHADSIQGGISLSGNNSCKNLTFIATEFGNPQISLLDNAVLDVAGSLYTNNIEENWMSGTIMGLNPLTGQVSPGTQLNFVGSDDQVMEDTRIFAVSRVHINKQSGNVTLNDMSVLSVGDSLAFQSLPSAIGAAPHGNLIVDSGNLYLEPACTISMLPYSNNEIPPHIVSKRKPNFSTQVAYGLIGIMPVTQQTVFSGTKLIPVGVNENSFNPIIINYTGTQDLIWFFSVQRGLNEPCTGNIFNINNAVQVQYYVVPSQGDNSPVSTIDEGADLSFTFHAANVNEDVLPSFNINNDPINIWRYPANDCYQELNGTLQNANGDYITATRNAVTEFPVFALSPQIDLTNDITIDVSPENNVPAEITINQGTLAMTSSILPASANQEVMWSIIPVSGAATINNNGLVTAVSNGTVFAKAVAVEDPSKADSVLISISNQSTSIDNIHTNNLSIYPNPVDAKGTLYLSLQKAAGAVQIVVTDLLGKVHTVNAVSFNQQNTLKIEMEGLTPGTYFLRLTGDNVTVTKKLIVR